MQAFANAEGTPMKGSMLSWALFAIVLLPMVAQPRLSLAEPLSPPSGAYELTARLELPHLERWGVDKTTIICLSNSRGSNEIPVPVVSANNPFQTKFSCITGDHLDEQSNRRRMEPAGTRFLVLTTVIYRSACVPCSIARGLLAAPPPNIVRLTLLASIVCLAPALVETGEAAEKI
jgi:hypothetical protein